MGPRWLHWLSRFEVAALALAAVAALAFHAWLPATLPNEQGYQAASEAIAKAMQPGDAVLLHPWWTERARLFLPDGVPVVGYLGSERADLAQAPRIWVLSQPELPGARNAEFLRAFSSGRTPSGGERRFGTLRLQLFRNGRARPTLTSFADALPGAKVWVESAGQAPVACSSDGRAFRCPGSQARAATEWHEVGFEPRRCLNLFPPGGAARLVVELAQAPAADRLHLEAGLIWERAAYTNAHLTAAQVGVDDASGRTLLQVQLPPGTEGYRSATAQPFVGGPLRLWISAAVPESREVCVDLRLQGPAQGDAS